MCITISDLTVKIITLKNLIFLREESFCPLLLLLLLLRTSGLEWILVFLTGGDNKTAAVDDDSTGFCSCVTGSPSTQLE